MRKTQNATWLSVKRFWLIAPILGAINEFRRRRSEALGHRWIEEIRQLLTRKQPAAGKLVRFGNENGDGGYVIADFDHSYDVLLSYGIQDDVSFELDFVKRHRSCQAHLFDHTIDRLPAPHQQFQFHREGLAGYRHQSYDTLSAHINKFAGDARSVFLKMDIEGAEYSSLLRTPPAMFKSIDQIAMEVHNFHPSNGYLKKLLVFLRSQYELIHVHGNNAAGSHCTAGHTVPYCLELTFIRRAFTADVDATSSLLPMEQDRPSCPKRAEMELTFLQRVTPN
jgi:hypothetical protein